MKQFFSMHWIDDPTRFGEFGDVFANKKCLVNNTVLSVGNVGLLFYNCSTLPNEHRHEHDS